MSEKNFQTWCVKTAEAAGWLGFKMVAVGRAGFPDLLFVGPGEEGLLPRVLFVEVKNPNRNGRLSPIQKYVLNKLTDHGAEAYVCDNKEQFLAILDGAPDDRARSFRSKAG